MGIFVYVLFRLYNLLTDSVFRAYRLPTPMPQRPLEVPPRRFCVANLAHFQPGHAPTTSCSGSPSIPTPLSRPPAATLTLTSSPSSPITASETQLYTGSKALSNPSAVRLGAPQQFMRNCGSRRFQQIVNETRAFISTKLGNAKLFAEQTRRTRRGSSRI